MNKFLPSALVAMAALGGAGAAFADAECQRTGTCGAAGHDAAVQQSYRHGYGYGYGYGHGVGANGLPIDGNQTLPAMIGLARQSAMQSGNFTYQPYAGVPYAWGVPQYQAPYQRSERDRDGDGVRNSRDRYPDDPRYR